jgi:hypothetical protein
MTESMLMLKKSHQLVWSGTKGELRDSARNNQVVFSGTYRQCVREARRKGIWY